MSNEKITSKWLLKHGWRRGIDYEGNYVSENEERKIEAFLYDWSKEDSVIAEITCWNLLNGKFVKMEIGQVDNDEFSEEDIIMACKICGAKY